MVSQSDKPGPLTNLQILLFNAFNSAITTIDYNKLVHVTLNFPTDPDFSNIYLVTSQSTSFAVKLNNYVHVCVCVCICVCGGGVGVGGCVWVWGCVLGLLTSDSPPPTIRLDKSGYRSPIRLASCLLKLSLSFLLPHPGG